MKSILKSTTNSPTITHPKRNKNKNKNRDFEIETRRVRFSILKRHTGSRKIKRSSQVTFSSSASLRTYYVNPTTATRKLSKEECEIKHPKVSLEALHLLLGQLDLETRCEAETTNSQQTSEVSFIENITEEITNLGVDTTANPTILTPREQIK